MKVFCADLLSMTLVSLYDSGMIGYKDASSAASFIVWLFLYSVVVSFIVLSLSKKWKVGRW